jgi:hypothetical protein
MEHRTEGPATTGSAPYRSGRKRQSAASFDGQTLMVPPGTTLPKVCLGCAKVGVKPKSWSHWIGSPWFRAILPFWGVLGALAARRSVSVRYALCDPCHRRVMNVEHAFQGIAVANIVVGIGFLTALFNGAPIAAGVVALLGWGLVYAAYRRFVRKRRFWIAGVSPCLRLGGVHLVAAEAIIEALEPPDPDGAASRM